MTPDAVRRAVLADRRRVERVLKQEAREWDGLKMRRLAAHPETLVEWRASAAAVEAALMLVRMAWRAADHKARERSKR